MIRNQARMLAVVATFIGGAATGCIVLGEELITANKSAVVRIGMVQSLFRGADAGKMLSQMQPFSELLYMQTGIRGQFCIVPDEAEMAKQIQHGDVQLGILHGIEYAWVKERYPDLQPLLLAFNQTIKLRGYLLVRGDSDVKTVADLKGKTAAIPKRSLNHCHLFLHKSIEDAGHDPAGFFASSSTPLNMDAAVDAVIDGQDAATVVDGMAWDIFQKRKPGRARKLRVLKESCLFPTAAFIYKPKSSDPVLTKKFYDGMTTAHERMLGRQMLNLWRLTNFSEVPEEYNQLLTSVTKVYPEPFQPASFFAEAVKPVNGEK